MWKYPTLQHECYCFEFWMLTFKTRTLTFKIRRHHNTLSIRSVQKEGVEKTCKRRRKGVMCSGNVLLINTWHFEHSKCSKIVTIEHQFFERVLTHLSHQNSALLMNTKCINLQWNVKHWIKYKFLVLYHLFLVTLISAIAFYMVFLTLLSQSCKEFKILPQGLFPGLAHAIT